MFTKEETSTLPPVDSLATEPFRHCATLPLEPLVVTLEFDPPLFNFFAATELPDSDCTSCADRFALKVASFLAVWRESKVSNFSKVREISQNPRSSLTLESVLRQISPITDPFLTVPSFLGSAFIISSYKLSAISKLSDI